MGFIGWIVLGLIAGAIAKAILKDRAPGGLLATLILGVVGAALGGWIGGAIFGVGLEEFWSIQTWIVAILGSLLVLVIYGAVAGRGSRR
ncbi:GlsB/YeaQ/YmgE family stress response membrane protein [Occultella gossypii]|uniref:GlsB/YeaQ/YmgE family stress response membrane protein n=1 Tax=Occultella gossypii TaxID=2800820 RepID=A0ABS7SEJ8_9MICO|nr:GlsB/YeaQ/YmgE family stress response membrane protein [Occultella gossypii]MBZ2198189.1 GlsB/YeaQ/YmgE family stress response membrane protein [Occultella gossypii]